MNLKKEISLYFFKKRWRKINKHNRIKVVNEFPLNIVKVGKYSYGKIIVKTWKDKREKLEIGNYVSIADGVKFLLGGNHEIDTFSTFPFKAIFFGEKEASAKGAIIVKDDVWIGMDSMILSGVTIGQGAIVAARSVVTKDVPPYAIVGGNPARILKYRFSRELIVEMEKVDWSKIEKEKIKDFKNEIYQKLNFDILEFLKGKLGG